MTKPKPDTTEEGCPVCGAGPWDEHTCTTAEWHAAWFEAPPSDPDAQAALYVSELYAEAAEDYRRGR